MKFLFRLFLSLSFLLLSGYGSIYAYPPQAPILQTSLKALEKSQNAAYLLSQKVQTATIRSSRRGVDNETHYSNAIEIGQEDEDNKEESSSKKCLSISSYLATFFYTPATGNLCSHIKTRLSFSQHFPYSSSDRYLVFGVFRI